MLIDNFAIIREDDAAGRPCAAQPVGTGDALSAAEPVEIPGGHLVPAPAAAGPAPTRPDTDVEPDLGDDRLASRGSAVGSWPGARSAASPEAEPRSITSPDEPSSTRSGRQLVELGLGAETVERFVTDYLQLLDGRLDAIRRCLVDSDIEGARVAVLSLESSSAMLGGVALSSRLRELRAHLDLGPTPQRNALLELAEVAASDFRSDLCAVGRDV